MDFPVNFGIKRLVFAVKDQIGQPSFGKQF